MLNSPRRHFLPWDRPLLPQAVAFLAGDWEGRRPLDLSRTLVVVPTRQSGRRLREALADYAARKKSAAFPPTVLTPEALVGMEGAADVATRIETIVAWTEVFRSLDFTDFREVFPVDPPVRNFAWALRLAEQFSRLQAILSENALRISEVAPKLEATFPEFDRWVQLGRLEQLHRESLRRAGLRPLHGRSIDPAQPSAWCEGIDRIILLATPDPMPIALSIIEGAAAPRTIDVLIYAKLDDEREFDPWGRPLTDGWKRRQWTIPRFEESVHLCADPAAQAQRISVLAHEYATRRSAREERGIDAPLAPGSPTSVNSVEEILAIGVADSEVLSLLEGELARFKLAAFNPEGRQRRSGGLYHLIAALAELGRAPTIDAVTALVRCPDFLGYLAAHCPQLGAAQLLAEFDRVCQRHLPPTLDVALAHAGDRAREPLALVAEVRSTLVRIPFPDNVSAVLTTIFDGRRLEPGSAADAQLEDAAGAWMEIAQQCRRAMRRFAGASADDWWELALRVYGESRRTEEKPAGALDLQGWLELLFEDAAHLVVAGLNDGLVPEAVSEDAFLPDSLRVRLGVKSNSARFARDAYILSAIAACRTDVGRLDLLYSKTSAAGDPLRPSRLLLQCSDEELPARVAFLFRGVGAAGSHLPWTRAWRLQPEVVSPPTQLAVTALRRWLSCPFRFYLKYVRRMEALDAGKGEMDAFDFGTLCHAALEAMSREPALRDCEDAATLRDFLWGELTRHARGRYGAEMSLPLLIQVESARQRLGKVAEIQARERAAGWITEVVERPFTIEINGLTVRGKIDRIDRHASTGAVRVLDYKTSDSAVTPQSAHLRPVRRDEVLPPWATCNIDDKVRAWVDLQLPLYRHALAAEWGSDVTCGYINLPKAIGQTALSVWDDYDAELHAAAMQCAEGVCGAIRAGQFWPPNETLRAETDEFAALFHHGVAESVAWRSAGDDAATGRLHA